MQAEALESKCPLSNISFARGRPNRGGSRADLAFEASDYEESQHVLSSSALVSFGSPVMASSEPENLAAISRMLASTPRRTLH